MAYFEKLAIRPRGRPSGSTEGSMLESEEIKGRWRVTNLRQRPTSVDPQRVETFQLKSWKDWYTRKYTAAKERIAELDAKVEDMTKTHREALKRRDQRIRAVEDELAQTKELLAARSTELTRAQSFLSTKDRLSEAEVLGIVRDLNENVFQVAAKLSEEWEKYRPSRSSRFKLSREEADRFSRSYGSVLVRHVIDRDPPSVTFLIQSCLCSTVTMVTSSWRRECYEELETLGSIYKDLCASEGQAISAKWRSLTHNHLPEPGSQFNSIAEDAAKILWLTGSFSSTESSFQFVKKVASSGIETISRLAIRLESVFMLDIPSSDMYLLFGTPNTEFDGTRMTEEVESGKSPARSRRRGKVAGTTEVGVEKFVCGGKGTGEDSRSEVLLKAKVILEGDLAGS